MRSSKPPTITPLYLWANITRLRGMQCNMYRHDLYRNYRNANNLYPSTFWEAGRFKSTLKPIHILLDISTKASSWLWHVQDGRDETGWDGARGGNRNVDMWTVQCVHSKCTSIHVSPLMCNRALPGGASTQWTSMHRPGVDQLPSDREKKNTASFKIQHALSTCTE